MAIYSGFGRATGEETVLGHRSGGPFGSISVLKMKTLNAGEIENLFIDFPGTNRCAVGENSYHPHEFTF